MLELPFGNAIRVYIGIPDDRGAPTWANKILSSGNVEEKKKGEKKRENGGIGRPDERRQFTQRVTNIQIGRHAIKYRGIRIDEVSARGIPRPGVLDRRPWTAVYKSSRTTRNSSFARSSNGNGAR